ncbi:muramidase [Chryseobacterium sp. Leaf180]|uniref:glucosaminidase domain-containing protein n=1 Tax=Chryseobacterium sp. Leaf180 TaxID=1736289 RepID=UPI0006F49FA6|nr:glucosaminidase domain-containing protein [Chryseobacterium sp. Leaf180]KQR94610.1 muramidase [Chryseobacterium sp. Leaf180]
MKHSFRYLRIVILSVMFSFTSILSNAQTHSYLEQNKKIANELSSKYGIPSSVILAIAFVESGGGTSKSSKTYNNHFGIVGKNNPTSKYKSFASVKESYEGFCKLVVNKGYYAGLKGSSDVSKWVKSIASAGYSTQPREWMRRINLIMSKYKMKND